LGEAEAPGAEGGVEEVEGEGEDGEED